MRPFKTIWSLWAILFLTALVVLFGSVEAQFPAPATNPGAIPVNTTATTQIVTSH